MTSDTKSEAELPEIIAIRTGEFSPLLKKWKRLNQRVPWSELLRSALKDSKELSKLATKRDAHILAN